MSILANAKLCEIADTQDHRTPLFLFDNNDKGKYTTHSTKFNTSSKVSNEDKGSKLYDIDMFLIAPTMYYASGSFY
jgi:hypothetical protein